MKQIYSILLGITSVFAIASCQQEIDVIETDTQNTVTGMTITASMGTETKTMLADNGKSTLWIDGDQISVFDSNHGDNNRCFTIDEGTEFPAATATFMCEEEFTWPQNDQPDPLVVALYPYQADAYCDYDINYITGVTIPTEQTAVAGGFDRAATLALATGQYSTRDNLVFSNLYSLLRITLTEADVKRITVTVGDGEYIAGAAKVQLNLVDGPLFDGGTLSAVADGGSQSVSLVCEEGFATDKTYYLAVAPGTYSTIKVYLDNILVKTIGEKTLEPNTIYGLKGLDNDDTIEAGTAEALTNAVTNAKDGQVVRLTDNITLSEILVINNSITLDGRNYTLTSSADRAINVSGAPNATIKNLVIEASGERAINIIQHSNTVTIENVTATADNYAVNVASSAPNATIIINSSDLSGLNVVNIAAAGTTVNIKDTDIVCTDNNANEGYGCISINKDAPGSRVTVTGGSINIEGSNTNESFAGSMTPEGAEIIFNDVEGVTTIEDCHFYIDYGNNSYASETLSEILKKAKDEDTIVLSKNYSINEALVINLENNITLDLQDYTITLTPPTSGSTPTEIKNYGTLTLTGGKIIAEDDILTRRCIYNYGTMTINGTEFVQQYESKGAAINNASKMIITDATVESKYFCIWNENANGDLTINGGTFTCNSYTEPEENNTDANNPTYSYAIRNTSSAKLTINNGEFNCTHGFASIEKGSATTIHGGNVKFTGELNQSAHTFYIFDETTKLTVDGGNVDWTNQNGSTLVYNVSGDSNNIVFTGGTFDITDCHNYSFPTL